MEADKGDTLIQGQQLTEPPRHSTALGVFTPVGAGAGSFKPLLTLILDPTPLHIRHIKPTDPPVNDFLLGLFIVLQDPCCLWEPRHVVFPSFKHFLKL